MNVILKLLAPIIKIVFSQISPQIRSAIEKFIKDLKSKAAKTPNVWDDMAVDLIASLLSIPE